MEHNVSLTLLTGEEHATEDGRTYTIKPPSRRSRYQAIINWLTRYQPSPESSNLDLGRHHEALIYSKRQKAKGRRQKAEGKRQKDE